VFGVAKEILRYINWIIIAVGIIVACDGFGSVIIKGGQYHNQLFDGERYFRATIGLFLITIGVLITGA
jgi:hypothetical protein